MGSIDASYDLGGLISLLVGGGSLQKPAASKTGNSSRTRPGMEPSSMLDGLKEDWIECGLILVGICGSTVACSQSWRLLGRCSPRWERMLHRRSSDRSAAVCYTHPWRPV